MEATQATWTVMLVLVFFATYETCSVLGAWGFNLCLVKAFRFVVVFFLL